MSNVIALLTRPQKSGHATHYQEVAVYGYAGPLTVTLARRTDAAGWIHVVLLGASLGLEIIATLPDDEKGRATADFVGQAVLRTAELSETEFAAHPEAC